MYSKLFCETLETSIQDSSFNKEDSLGIKLYKIQLIKFQEFVPDLINFLSSSERNRASRYHFNKDKNRFIICRTLLKILLAEHIGLKIGEVILDVDSNKKPFLPSHPFVFFNVSHAGDYAIIAIAKSPIGVDIEYVDKNFDYKEILPSIFNTSEIDKVNHSDDKHVAFYGFWTRKEAVVKAVGKGIDGNSFKIPVTNGFHSVPLSLVSDFKTINVFSFILNDDYLGAVAITEDINKFGKIVFSPIPTFDHLKFLIKKK